MRIEELQEELEAMGPEELEEALDAVEELVADLRRGPVRACGKRHAGTCPAEG